MVVLDLDGLILDTETLCTVVAAEVLKKRGATLTASAVAASLGKRPLEAWVGVAKELKLGGAALGTDANTAAGETGANAAAGGAAAADVAAEAIGAELLAESEPLLSARWGEARPMPGALRLLRHLAALSVPVAVATSTPRASFEKKLAGKPELRALLTRCGGSVACGDEVSRGKPAPDVFELAVAKLLLWRQEGKEGEDEEAGGDPKALLPAAREALAKGAVAVFEDAPSGVEGALAAGARVVVVPSLRDPAAYPPSEACCSSGGGCVAANVPSLLAFDPRCLGLAPFDDLVPSSALPAALARAGARAAVPLDPPLRIRGKVVRGFGRGSRELGIPTANVDPDALVTALSEAVTGVYVGWACVVGPGGGGGGNGEAARSPRLAVSGGEVGVEGEGEGEDAGDNSKKGKTTTATTSGRDGIPPGVYPSAMSCGYNPQFANDRRTLEPWVLADYGEGVEFYGETISLVITGYLRPEAKFVSVEKLVEQIHGDARDARRALADGRFLRHACDAFLTEAVAGAAEAEGG